MVYEPEVPLEPKPFLEALSDAMRPEDLAEAADDLALLVQAVHDLRKKGRLRLTVEISPEDRLPDLVSVTSEVDVKLPKREPTPVGMWPIDGGQLSNRDPAQLSLDDHADDEETR